MRQEFNWAMDQVRLPPQAEARILRTLEEGQAGKTPRRKGRKGPLIAVLAAAAVLLMGAAAWQSGLLRYFQGPGGSPASGLSRYSAPVGVSGTSEDGWTLTVEECMGDDQWVFLWLTLAAPEGTELPALGEGDSFYVNVSVPGLGMDKIQVYDLTPGDNRLQAAAGLRAGRDLRGEVVSLQVNQVQYRPAGGGEIIPLQRGTFTVEGIPLDYPDTVTRSRPMVQIPCGDSTALLTQLTVTPFAVSLELDCPWEERPDLALSLSMADGAEWALTPTFLSPSRESSRQWIGYWEYRLEVLGPGGWDEAFFLDPAQVESLTLNGVSIPFAFHPR